MTRTLNEIRELAGPDATLETVYVDAEGTWRRLRDESALTAEERAAWRGSEGLTAAEKAFALFLFREVVKRHLAEADDARRLAEPTAPKSSDPENERGRQSARDPSSPDDDLRRLPRSAGTGRSVRPGPVPPDGVQSLAWHARDREGEVVREEIRAATRARGVPVYDVNGKLLER